MVTQMALSGPVMKGLGQLVIQRIQKWIREKEALDRLILD